MLKLSIIIPAYNVAAWIEATLSLPPVPSDRGGVEVVVVNDGSTDNTAEVVKTFMEEHPMMSIRLIQQDNQGVSAARNRGLHEAKGEYVWFVDGDDLIHPSAIESLFDIIDRHPGVDVIKTAKPKKFQGDVEEYESFERGNTICCKGVELFNEPYSGLYIYHGRHIWRREMLTKSGIEYPVGIVINEDFCFTIQGLLKAKTSCEAPWLQAYFYRKHDSSATSVRRNPDRFMPRVVSGLKALQLMKDSLDEHKADEQAMRACKRVQNLMVAMNITHLMDPLPLSFVRKSMRVLEEMGAYPFTPEQDHSRLLRFVLQHKWAIYAVSQYRRLRYKMKCK